MISNIKLLVMACQNLKIDYEILHSNQNLVRVKLDKNYYFCNYQTPLISESLAQILRDKEYTYQILLQNLKQPRTMAFLSPFCEERYQKYLKFSNIEDIVLEIKTNFDVPVIIKRNSGASGHNVFLCNSELEITTALTKIYDIHDKDYDYVALAQEYIDIRHEYRAIFLNKELMLVYEKSKSDAKFIGNLSPLHWDGAKAKYIDEPQILSEIKDFAQPIFQELELDYAGLDIAVDQNNNYWLIEINSHPNYDIFTRDNGEEIIVKIFEKMLIFLGSK